MYHTFCRSYSYPDRPKKEKDHSEERPELSVLFSVSSPPKLSVSNTTDQLARSGLMVVETDS